MMSRLDCVLLAIDAANEADPNRVTVDGRDVGAEWLYGQRMSATLATFAPQASEALIVAARGQHIERWTSPRASYPEGRVGYLKWRHELKAYHGRRLAEIALACGYEAAMAERIAAIIRKDNLRTDADVQALEDVACLVFLRHHLEPFAASRPIDVTGDILAKTWRKMSEPGHQAALALGLPPAMVDALHAGLARLSASRAG
jgi:hypothetical protein